MNKKTKTSKKAARPVQRNSANKSRLAKREVVKTGKKSLKKAVVSTITKKRVSKAIKAIPSGGIPSAAVMEGVGRALQDVLFLDYVAKNVGSQANEVLKELAKGPRKDEQLAEIVSIKLNEVRRVLNLLNRHGIVRYDVKRDSSGWLTFEWHVDHVSFSDFYNTLSQKSALPSTTLPTNCNDFFMCGDCTKKQNIIYPFDVAYEKSFRCNCGKSLEMLTRNEAEAYIKN